jgi:hypothetical protein
MARPTTGWRLQQDPRNGNFKVRFTHAGKRYHVSTGERDPRDAARSAERIYADVVSRRPPSSGVSSRSSTAMLDEVAAKWLASEDGVLDVETWKQYAMYVRAHWQPFFKTVDRLTSANAEAYWRERVRHVMAKTARMELSALRKLARWAHQHGYLAELPAISSPPKNVTGVRDTSKRHKVEAVELSEAEIEAILAAMPEMTPGRGKRSGFAVRALRSRLGDRSSTGDARRPPRAARLRARSNASQDPRRGGQDALRPRDPADAARTRSARSRVPERRTDLREARLPRTVA